MSSIATFVVLERADGARYEERLRQGKPLTKQVPILKRDGDKEVLPGWWWLEGRRVRSHVEDAPEAAQERPRGPSGVDLDSIWGGAPV